MEGLFNAFVWLAAGLSLILGGLIATAFVFMATSLDPIEMLSVGTEPWMNALVAVVAFAVLAVGTFVGLRLWRSERFRPFGAILVAVQFALVVEVCAKVYAEYF